MKKIILAAYLLAAPAAAQSIEAINLASSLGQVLASEKTCQLSFDLEALANFIETAPAASDPAFPSSLEGSVWSASNSIEDKTAAEMIIHCGSVKRIAQGYGFLN